MENVNKLLYLAFASVVFCMGLIFLVYEIRSYRDVLETTRESYKNQELYQQYNTTEESIVPRSELIATLFQPLDYDIKIDDFIIRRTEHSTDKISGYGINKKNYFKSYEYDLNGNLTMVVYKSTG
jgi:hypothetical protein